MVSFPSQLQKAIHLLTNTEKILAKSNLKLHKIAFNSCEIMTAFEPVNRAKELDLAIHPLPMQCSLRIFWNLKTDALHFEGFLRGQAVHTQRYPINGQQRVWPVRFCSIGYVIWQCPGQRGFIKTWLGCLLQLRKRRWMETVERLTTSSAADEHTKVLHKCVTFEDHKKR